MPDKSQAKIAFLGAGFIQWTGGVDFLRLCISGVNAAQPGQTWPVLMPRPNRSQRALALAVKTKRRLWALFGVPPAVDPHVSIEHLRDAITSAGSAIRVREYYDSRQKLSRAIEELEIDVVLPSIVSLGRGFPHRWIGYIPDLQHKRLPRNFTERECRERDKNFTALLNNARAVIVNSQSVVRDIRQFYPESKAELFSLPFCPPANPDFFEELRNDELRTYNLPKRYFIVCNQFWIHKSHQTAFEALRLVHDAGFTDVHMLCTGNLHDYRAPGYLETLKEGIAQQRLSEHVRFLGIVPKRHQLAIMRRSVAVVQPTLFEGGPGGGALYDGVSTATPVIMSDIDVNREADLGVFQFFKAGSAESLAEKMINVLQNPPQRLSAEATLTMLRERQRQMGAAILNVAKFVSNASAPKSSASRSSEQ